MKLKQIASSPCLDVETNTASSGCPAEPRPGEFRGRCQLAVPFARKWPQDVWWFRVFCCCCLFGGGFLGFVLFLSSKIAG